VDELADQPPPEADGYGMGTRTGLELGEQVTHMRFHRFLGQEQSLADLAIHESVGDELQHLDLAHGGLLLELAQWALQRDHVRTACPSALRGDLLEPSRVGQITAEDLLALSSVHARVSAPRRSRFSSGGYLERVSGEVGATAGFDCPDESCGSAVSSASAGVCCTATSTERSVASSTLSGW
jgi:hypothetical protein